MKIMLADDEPSMRKIVRLTAEDGGYEFCAVNDGAQLLDTIDVEKPDLLILDVMMPRIDGFQVCSRLRERGLRIPIIFLSAKGDIVDKGVGFSVGADDYLVKPFSPEELLMRINAHLRQFERASKMALHSIQEGDVEIDLSRFRVLCRGAEVPFTPKEFQVLSYLAQHRNEVVTREQLTQEVWGDHYCGETSSIAVFIRKIREKIEADPSHPCLLRTVRNIGYIFGLG
ncbi:MAG: response regulator transcription factor [Coriobacteriaceae bacterium]|jgi:two-component system response regulator VicR|nr:response regulator transcription factor [Coriobacteriaceae bacterium]